jgi:uncharacterized protein (TIGR03118 family)
MNYTEPKPRHRVNALIVYCSAIVLLLSCQKSIQSPPNDLLASKKTTSQKKTGHFTEVNLVADVSEYHPLRIDPTLINAWGIAFAPTGVAWVNSQAGHVSEVFDAEGNPLAIDPVQIPNPVSMTGGNPTGIVFNGTSDFVISGGPARFIFVGVDGVISAWNPTLGKQAARVQTVSSAAFTGLTMGTLNGMNLLYAADFRSRIIRVWDGSWNPVSMSFTDPMLPSGYAPYNIQSIANYLFVAYAKVASNGRSEAGLGEGLVSIFRLDGTFVRRLATGGTLNAPWGLTAAPASFIKNEDEGDHKKDPNELAKEGNVILVGNFGDGRINAYSLSGKFLGQLRGTKGQALTIEGLWALKFPPASSSIDPTRLYFSAGPDEETHGVFGYIKPAGDDDDKE